jgi:FAD/FMN-containing dehydrogenase
VSRACLDAVLAHVAELRDPLSAPHPWYVLAQFDDNGSSAELQERVAQALAEREAVLAQSGEQARRLWRIRESIPEAQFANVKHDISLPISRIADFVAHAERELKASFVQTEIYCFGHVGDGNLHYNVGPERLLASRDAINRIVYDAVERLGGSISAEHGIGQLKREAIRRHKPAVEFELMRKLKTTLDPQGLMNPGKVL